ncbi:MAG: hypothetical protein GWN83_21260, partial [Gemmatimonadetes bacterium]|nr:hypothetical protein [Gemmatimonadota bacterium]
MSPTLAKICDAPFRLVFRSMSPFAPWPLNYDRYNDWFQVKRWMRKASYGNFSGRGAGFGYHKYFVQPFYIHALMRRFTPGLMKPYFATCFAVERMIGSWIPFRWTM